MPIKKGSTDFCPAKTSEVYVGNKLVWENVKEKVVKGVTTLTVNDALARPVKALTRFGKCTQPSVTMYSTITQQGKLVQDGTPTPTTPVDIMCNNGVLKVSKNLFDYSYFYDNYQEVPNSAVGRCPIKLQPNTTYTVSTNRNSSQGNSVIFVASGNSVYWTPSTASNGVLVNSSRTVTTDSNGYLCLGIYVSSESAIPESDFINGTVWAQIEQGSTATPYMPYGQIYTDGTAETLTVGGQTISVTDLFAIGNYKDALDIVSGIKTKRIRARVLTGSADEGWFKASGRNVFSASAFFSDMIVKKTLMYCTHFAYSDDASTSIANLYFGSANTSTNTFFRYDAISTLEEWCTFLAEQLAAGTPVIIVYVLAEETTEQLTPADIVLTYPQTIMATTAVGDVTITETHADVSTPSPRTPLPIWCNNGVLRVNYSILDPTNIYGNYLLKDNGTIGNVAANFYLTNFIPVKPSTSYTFSFRSGADAQYRRLAEYTSDDEDTFVKLTIKMPKPTAVDDVITRTFVTSPTTNYIRLSSSALDTEQSIRLSDYALNEVYVDGTSEVLTIGMPSRVPDGWTEVEYIESDGTAYAITPALQLQNSEFHLDFQCTDVRAAFYQDVWSGYNLSNEGVGILRNKAVSPQKLQVTFNSPNEAVFTPDFSSRLVLDATVGTDSFTAVLNGDSQTVSSNIRQSGVVMALFGMSYGDGTGVTSLASGHLYSAWHKNTATGEYDFYAIPVKNDTSGEYAIYDSASDTIIHSAEGTFTGGEAVSPSEQTASVTDIFGLGDYTDTDEIISGLKTKKICAVALTGAETWTYESQYNRFYTRLTPSIVNPSGTRSIPVLCTQYEMLWHGESISGITAGQGYIARTSVSSVTNLYLHSDLTTVEAFTAKVAERYASGNPIIAIYPLETETTEQLTPQPLNMAKGTNTLLSESELGTVVDVELKYYVKRIVT